MSSDSLLDSRRSRLLLDASACRLDDLAYCGGVDVTAGADIVWTPLGDQAVTTGWPSTVRLGGLLGTVGDVVRANSEVDRQLAAELGIAPGERIQLTECAALRSRCRAWSRLRPPGARDGPGRLLLSSAG